MRKTDYVIIRRGSNAANQSLCNRMVVGIIQAASRDEARRLAEERWTFYQNQSSEAIPASRASARDWNAAVESERASEVRLLADLEKGAQP